MPLTSFAVLGLGSVEGTEVLLAYLDPGTGSLVLQMAFAGFLGGLYAMKGCWQHVRLALARGWRK